MAEGNQAESSIRPAPHPHRKVRFHWAGDQPDSGMMVGRNSAYSGDQYHPTIPIGGPVVPTCFVLILQFPYFLPFTAISAGCAAPIFLSEEIFQYLHQNFLHHQKCR